MSGSPSAAVPLTATGSWLNTPMQGLQRLGAVAARRALALKFLERATNRQPHALVIVGDERGPSLKQFACGKVFLARAKDALPIHEHGCSAIVLIVAEEHLTVVGQKAKDPHPASPYQPPESGRRWNTGMILPMESFAEWKCGFQVIRQLRRRAEARGTRRFGLTRLIIGAGWSGLWRAPAPLSSRIRTAEDRYR